MTKKLYKKRTLHKKRKNKKSNKSKKYFRKTKKMWGGKDSIYNPLQQYVNYPTPLQQQNNQPYLMQQKPMIDQQEDKPNLYPNQPFMQQKPMIDQQEDKPNLYPNQPYFMQQYGDQFIKKPVEESIQQPIQSVQESIQPVEQPIQQPYAAPTTSSYKTTSSVTSSSPEYVGEYVIKKKVLTTNEKEEKLMKYIQDQFNEKIESYLTTTCQYEDKQKIDELKNLLIKKFIEDSKATTFSGEKKVIKGYLHSLHNVFECLMERKNKSGFIGTLGLGSIGFGDFNKFKRRITYLIDQIIQQPTLKINKKSREQLCNNTIQNVK
jgi:hypothetical protein